MPDSTNTRAMPRDAALRERAAAVIPNGMYGHQNVHVLPDNFPQFFSRGEGAHIWDVDGNEYIDYLCSYGPILLGHAHPGVDRAAAAELETSDCLNGPGEKMVELAELLVDITPWADWAWFAKNGTDATVYAATVARAATGRGTILRASGAYHGSAPTWMGLERGSPADGTIEYAYNDLASVRAAIDAADGDFAGLMVSAFKHDVFIDQEMPTQEFAQGVRDLCDAHGAVLILDDVRGGFRLDIRGSWAPLGVDPDLSAYCKAIGNGYPISALLGRDSLAKTVGRVMATGSYWYSSGPMAAAVATITTMQETSGIAHIHAMGERLRNGLADRAAAHGLAIRQTGPVEMPLLIFDADDADAKADLFTLLEVPRVRMFSAELAERGVYMHPFHNGFLSAALTKEDIDHTIAAGDEAFAAIRAQFSDDPTPETN